MFIRYGVQYCISNFHLVLYRFNFPNLNTGQYPSYHFSSVFCLVLYAFCYWTPLASVSRNEKLRVSSIFLLYEEIFDRSLF